MVHFKEKICGFCTSTHYLIQHFSHVREMHFFRVPLENQRLDIYIMNYCESFVVKSKLALIRTWSFIYCKRYELHFTVYDKHSNSMEDNFKYIICTPALIIWQASKIMFLTKCDAFLHICMEAFFDNM